MNEEKRPLVRFVRLPDWVATIESREIFEFCLGKVFPSDGLDEHGHVCLDVSEVCDPKFGGFMNEIRLELK